jgi:site-specific DNA-cytosine methylase
MIEVSIFGVPQSRHRFVMIATDKKIKIDQNPFETLLSMAKSFRKDRGLRETDVISVSNAISDLQIHE